MKIAHTRMLLALAAGTSLITSGLQAEPNDVVRWGIGTDIVTGSYFGGNINSTALSLAAPMTDLVGGGYYADDPSRGIDRDRSVNVYIAAWTNSVNAAAEANFRVLPANTFAWHPAIYDTLILNAGLGDTNPADAGGIALWQKSDGFINGFDAQPVAFADLSIRMVLANNAEQNPELKSNRIVVRNGSQFYVSNDIGGNLANLTIFTTLTDVQDLITEWFAYDPLTDASAIGASASPVLDDITAIGLLNTVADWTLQFYSTMIAEFSVSVQEAAAYELTLERSDNLQDWSKVTITPGMITPEGTIEAGSGAASEFYRLAIDVLP